MARIIFRQNEEPIQVDETAEDIARNQQEAIDEATKISEAKAVATQLATDKASAKAKLIAGEALTEAEADTIVL